MTVLEGDITISADEIARRVAEIHARQEAAARPAPQRRRWRGRPQTAVTRRRLSERQRRHHAARALAEGEISPLRRLRIERELTLKEAANLCLVSETAYRNAEVKPEEASPITWARIAQGFKVSAREIIPRD